MCETLCEEMVRSIDGAFSEFEYWLNSKRPHQQATPLAVNSCNSSGIQAYNFFLINFEVEPGGRHQPNKSSPALILGQKTCRKLASFNSRCDQAGRKPLAKIAGRWSQKLPPP